MEFQEVQKLIVVIPILITTLVEFGNQATYLLVLLSQKTSIQ